MDRHFDDELKELQQDVLKMGIMAEEAIVDSIQALEKKNKNLALKIIADDRKVDEWELRIEEKCVDLLALHQPMAIDLRFITTAMKLNGELERIADLSVDIAQRVLQLADKPLLKPLIDIPKLSKIAQEMVRQSIEAFVHRDIALAKKVIFSDAQADELRNRVQEELINDYMSKDMTTVPRAVPLLLIARHLERICDHATNIAEDVIYMVGAKVVKHHPEELK
ncbi:MAG: phosphate signaling complex protein PhoU [Chlamydiae bacterium]|nr:phosphate signaling complex protein PhoU [Chlamydiota bacterium]MBI3266965.1 phosphate signaling complex protein PhoU [Chlamydiota bacterium]